MVSTTDGPGEDRNQPPTLRAVCLGHIHHDNPWCVQRQRGGAAMQMRRVMSRCQMRQVGALCVAGTPAVRGRLERLWYRLEDTCT